MKLYKYTEQNLKNAVKACRSMRQVLKQLGVSPYGGNYDVLRKAIEHFQLDTSHFSGQAWNKGKSLPGKTATSDYLANKVPIQPYKLKQRLLNTLWLNKPISLELDHINGNNKDNRLENLRLLCPNCHALTPTYRSKNRTKT